MTLASGLDTGASAGAHALARYRSEFPIFRDAVYLNTCSLGALGDRTRRRIAEFFDLWQARGASAWYDVWWAALGELRARYARIVGASPDEIALDQAGTTFVVPGTVTSVITPVTNGHLVTVSGTFQTRRTPITVTLQTVVNKYSAGQQ